MPTPPLRSNRMGFAALSPPYISRRIRRPHPSGDRRAALAFDHRYIELALEIEPELCAVAEIAPKANGSIGRDRTPAVQNIRDPAGRHADVERRRFALKSRIVSSRFNRRPR